MTRRKSIVRLPGALAVCAGLLAAGVPALSATITVEPGGGRLETALRSAAAGDTVLLGAGVHAGPVLVEKSLILKGEPGAIVDGGGRGRVIAVTSADVAIMGLTVRNSGSSLAKMDAGIVLGKTAHRARVEGNRLEGNLFGIYVLGPDDALVRGNVVIGRRDLRENERGNGIQLWRTPGTRVIGNDIRYGRDGIFVETSENNVFRGNRMRDLRFAIHYMYTNKSVVEDNLSIGNDIGYAIMFSHRLVVRGNLSQGDREQGMLFNYANRSAIENNIVRPGAGNRAGPSRCVFMYNANRNRFRSNHFTGCRIGIHFTAGSERNVIAGNAFIGNRRQVKYVGTRALEWSQNGRGNYWSDNAGFDLDGNGTADAPYRPNNLVDRIVWSHPAAKILLNSPATQMLRFMQSHFPALYPGGVVDSAPLMKPPVATPPVYMRGDSL